MTTATADPPRLLTAEEYAALPADGRLTELVRGVVIHMNPPYPFHGFVCGKIDRLVGNFVDGAALGRVLPNDSGVVTERGPDTVRGADICFYSFARLPAGPMPEDEYLAVVPELVFEVQSPSDRRARILQKVVEYLDAGVTAVVVVNPQTRSATVYRDDRDEEMIPADGELTLPDVLPGFRVAVRQFFE